MLGFIPLVQSLFGLGKTFIEGKQKQSEQKAENKRKQLEVEGQSDLAATKAMAQSWKDEYWLVVFSLPLIGMFLSPYLDVLHTLYSGASYQSGMLLAASTQALVNLEAAPLWYRVIIIMMVAVSYGYRKLINWYLTRNS